ncbi:transcriptional regulator [Aeromicrobium sp. CTD01-1L150]|uniref:transcriptional regulator n=1 Tax=Aeromicrobium sp. CTD01-1L150 TaxID=3341830 RepID=UPI0035C05F3B
MTVGLVRSRGTTMAGGFLALALVLSGCSGSDDESSDSPPSEAPTSEAAEADAVAGEEAEVEIAEAFEDPDMGDSLEIISAVRDFPSEEHADLIADGGEVVLVQVKVAPGEEYGGRISTGNFEISWDDGADFWNDKTRMVTEEMAAADRPELEDVARRDGGETTGWVAFLVDEKADTYLLNYTRDGAKVIGSDETVDEFTHEVEIPAP